MAKVACDAGSRCDRSIVDYACIPFFRIVSSDGFEVVSPGRRRRAGYHGVMTRSARPGETFPGTSPARLPAYHRPATVAVATSCRGLRGLFLSGWPRAGVCCATTRIAPIKRHFFEKNNAGRRRSPGDRIVAAAGSDAGCTMDIRVAKCASGHHAASAVLNVDKPCVHRWQHGPAPRDVARHNPVLVKEFSRLLDIGERGA